MMTGTPRASRSSGSTDRAIGLKKPITVTERDGADGAPAYLLVCGEGRLNAFRLLGETYIPALVVNVTDEDAFIMSAGRKHCTAWASTAEILADIELLLARDFIDRQHPARWGFRELRSRHRLLLEKAEERLIEAVQNGTIPLTTALEIARAKHDDGKPSVTCWKRPQDWPAEGVTRSPEAKRLIEKRRERVRAPVANAPSSRIPRVRWSRPISAGSPASTS
ncbi:MAG: ParB N-terminal domain-containing protein [Devosia sp.]|nr:ParB N-terminal domain-containing protein [Devosia sp.]